MITKTFVGNKPQTNAGITEADRRTFEEYNAELRAILKGSKHTKKIPRQML